MRDGFLYQAEKRKSSEMLTRRIGAQRNKRECIEMEKWKKREERKKKTGQYMNGRKIRKDRGNH